MYIHLTHGSLGSRESVLRTTSRSVQLFLRSSSVCVCVCDKHNDRPARTAFLALQKSGAACSSQRKRRRPNFKGTGIVLLYYDNLHDVH